MTEPFAVNRLSSTQIDNAIDRIKRELRTLEEELALLEAELNWLARTIVHLESQKITPSLSQT